jgi:hypothetical protein
MVVVSVGMGQLAFCNTVFGSVSIVVGLLFSFMLFIKLLIVLSPLLFAVLLIAQIVVLAAVLFSLLFTVLLLIHHIAPILPGILFVLSLGTVTDGNE